MVQFGVNKRDVESVSLAARWLDKVNPGWAKRVDFSILDMMNPRRCILGQVFQPSVWHPSTWNKRGYSAGFYLYMKQNRGTVRYAPFVASSLIPLWKKEVEFRLDN